ncbi:MAG: VWA domain-containing protein, partial [Chloroflexaceae bacterium]|nr:VWA domain-containing protein [Chloroflexaceae bacterium]
MLRKRSAALLLFFLLVPTIAACTGAGNTEASVQATVAAITTATDTARQAEANMQATIQAAVQATAAAAQPSPTTAAAAAATPGAGQAAAPGRTGSPTAASPANPTVGPGGPLATTTPAVAGTAPATSGTAPAGTPAAGTSGDTTVPTTFRPEGGEAARQTVNIQLVFDASGSMAEQIGSETRIEAARKAIQQVIDKLPDDAGDKLNVGFRVFGHQGDNTQAGRAESCQSTELLVPVQGVNKDLLRQQALSWEPTGWTPITLALQKAGESMPPASENVRNIIILVTDGEETCDRDPCAAAKALRESGAEVRVDVVGFGLTPQVADTLKCVAENSGGLYVDAKDGPSLAQTLESLIDLNKGGVLYIKAVGPRGELATYAREEEIKDANGQLVDGEAGLSRTRDGAFDNITKMNFCL